LTELRDEIFRTAVVLDETLRNAAGTFLAMRRTDPPGILAVNIAGKSQKLSIEAVEVVVVVEVPPSDERR
jgi:hypothetical protein